MSMVWQAFAGVLSEEQQAQVVQRAIEDLRGVPVDVLRDRKRLWQKAHGAVLNVLQRLGWSANDAQIAALVSEVASRVSGLGFLEALLKPDKYSEVILNPDGRVFVQRRGQRYPEEMEYRPSLEEAMRVAETLAGLAGQQLSVANPTVNARLPRQEQDGFGGARVKILHPVLLVGEGYPSITIRLFYPRRILPKDLIEWEAAPEGVIKGLLDLTARKARIMVMGGTNMGKTTLLSALCEGIPREARILKVEDPEEIFLDHPNVVTIEPFYPSWAERKSTLSYTMSDAIADAMRMRPDWLIVGEVRRGRDVMNLLRAQMSGHPGLTSLHAYGPAEAVQTVETLVYNDLGIGRAGTKATLALALDVMVYLDWKDGKRRIMGVWEVGETLKGGDVRLRALYEYGASDSLEPVNRRLLGD